MVRTYFGTFSCFYNQSSQWDYFIFPHNHFGRTWPDYLYHTRMFYPQAISGLFHAHSKTWILCCHIVWLPFAISNGLLGERCVTSIQGVSLLKQNYKSVPVQNMFACYYLCKDDVICQSLNFYKDRNVCELNNRTRSVRLFNFVSDSSAIYLENPFRGKF